MEGGTEINCAWIGTYRALEWQQLNRITVGLCLCWHKVTLRARNPNCEITGRSRYGKGLRELEGGGVGFEDKKLPHTGWEIRYEFGVGGLSQAEIGLLWAERLG